MKKGFAVFVGFLVSLQLMLAQPLALKTPFEKTGKTATYPEIIQFYKSLSTTFSQYCKLTDQGVADGGQPLNLLVLSEDGINDPMYAKGRLIVMINNGIHPGEPEGIDASMALARDLCLNPEKLKGMVVLIVPVFNIGGCLNRGKYSRANQNGPEEHGFRGNAKNLDLNRDFMKAEASETRGLIRMITRWMPHVFVDTHTSNGADYQYTVTYIETQPDKLGKNAQKVLRGTITPELNARMVSRGFPMVPYVHHIAEVPDSGIETFVDGPRYLTGFTSLFGCIGYTLETHMLKPFADRVAGTRAFLDELIAISSGTAKTAIIDAVNEDRKARFKTYFFNYKPDLSVSKPIEFKGYEAGYKPSEVSGFNRLYYDRNKPFTKQIPYYYQAIPTDTVSVPKYYVIPTAWYPMTLKLMNAGITVYRLEKDSSIAVTSTYIRGYNTTKQPYEGQYLHFGVQAERMKQVIQFHKGDCLIPTDQVGIKYILESLEPTAADSWFCWGYLDAVLNQKEYFSDYVFEDCAAQLLKDNPALRAQLEAEKATNEKLRNSGDAQLEWVYKHSPYYEISHNRLPIFRIE